MDEKAKKAEEALQDKIRRVEGIGPLTCKPFWNWLPCPHNDYCERKKDENIKYCSYNPKMFRCPAYQKYEGIE